MRTSTIAPAYVDTIPDLLEDGVLYVCERYSTAAHKCCCGCGNEVVTPLTPADWSVRKEKHTISLTPSIGNWSFSCRSHYWIHKNKVIWAGEMSQRQIDKVRARDKDDKEAHIASVNRQKKQQAGPTSLVVKLWNGLILWWKSKA